MVPRIDRLAMRPVGHAARSGIDGMLAGKLPETVARSLVEHRVVSRIAAEMLEAAGEQGHDAEELEWLVERVLTSAALTSWVESGDAGRLLEPLVARVLESDAVRRTVVDVAASPELRGALSTQTRGFGGDIAAAGRRAANAGDESVETHVRSALHVPVVRSARREAGLCTRGLALAIDACLAHLVFLLASASIALVVSLVGSSQTSIVTRSLMGAAWIVLVIGYFVAFWSATGQTPGMRLLRLRVETHDGGVPSVKRSFVRVFGLLLAIAPLLLGFLPVLFDRRRRALQDYLAGTTVVHDTEPGPPPPPSALRSSYRVVADARMHAMVGGEGPPVVLVHGYGASGGTMLPLAEALSTSFTTLVPDLPGQGRSDARGRPEIGELADALGDWLDAAGVERPLLVANSMGCQVVTELAVRRPDRVGPLVLIGPTVDPSRRKARRQLFNALRDSRREPLSLVALAAHDSVSSDARHLLGAARAALADRIEERLPLIRQRAVVVHGSDDAFVGREWSERAAALLPRGRLVVVEGEPHAVQYTRPDAVAAIVHELAVEEAEDARSELARELEHRRVTAVQPGDAGARQQPVPLLR